MIFELQDQIGQNMCFVCFSEVVDLKINTQIIVVDVLKLYKRA